MNRRHFGIGLFAGAGLAFAQESKVDNQELSADLITPEVKRVGVRLKCLCGCAMTVGECNMVGCHYASPSREKIRNMLKQGMTDDQIVDVFVKEEGIKVLAAPPAQGFNWFGYSAPYIVGGLGAVVVGFVVKRMMAAPAPEAPTASNAPSTTPAELDRYNAAAAKDLDDIEE